MNAALDGSQRVEAASRLLGRPADEAQGALARAFGDEKAPGAVVFFARAVSEHPSPPPWAAGPLGRALSAAPLPPEMVPPLLNALGVFHSRDAVEPVIRFVQSRPSPEQLAPAFAALVRQTGNEAPGSDVNAWSAWWTEVQWIPEGDWRLRIAAAHAARSARLTREREALAGRVMELLGRIHAATPVEQRSALLASMLRDELVEVRTQGVELALRALANAQPLDQTVMSAAFDCLGHTSVSVRAGAARLLENLAPEEGHPRLLEALMAERDARVAAPLLRILAKKPTVGYAQDALRWLEQPGVSRDAAAEALLALHRAGTLPEEARSRAISTIRAIEPERLTVGAVRLFGAIGDAGDAPTMEELLRTGDRAVRLVAAEVVANYPRGVDPLLRAAGSDPELLDAAVRAVMTHRNTAAGYFALGPVAAGAGERGTAALHRVFVGLPLDQVLMVVDGTSGNVPESLIVAALSDRPTIRDHERAARRLLTMLGAMRMERSDYNGAVEAIDRLLAEGIALDQGATRVRCVSLAALGRVEDAAATGGAAADWLDALERCVSMPHATQIHAHIVRAFGSSLDEAASARLAALAARLVGGEASPEPQTPPEQTHEPGAPKQEIEEEDQGASAG